jgi:hypothetical protein
VGPLLPVRRFTGGTWGLFKFRFVKSADCRGDTPVHFRKDFWQMLWECPVALPLGFS